MRDCIAMRPESVWVRPTQRHGNQSREACFIGKSGNARAVRGVGSIPGSGRSPGGGNSNTFQYSCLENPMERTARWAIVYKVTNRLMQLK